jgi:ankyrin repeat protein
MRTRLAAVLAAVALAAAGLSAVSHALSQDRALDEKDRALIAAAWGNRVEEARRLIAAGADVNRKDSSQQSAYLIATSEGYLELLQLTLANGADVHSTDSYNGTGLIRAADRGHVEIVRELLKTPIRIDHVNRLGWTALLEAVILGNGGQRHTETVRLLVAAGANVNLADQHGVTPLAHARKRGFNAMAAILEQAGGKVRLSDGKIDARDALGRTALMRATYAGDVKEVRALLEAGADVNLRDSMQNNPFLYAGAEGMLEIVKLTAKAGADTRITNRYGGTALIPAAHHGHVEVVNYLLEHTNVDVNHVNRLGWTALLEAIVLSDGGPRHQKIVAALIRHGANVNLADGSGRTPLQHASSRGYVEIAALLKAAGAS